MMTARDRRQYPRLAVDLPVTLRHGGRLIPATALNISCGGILLAPEAGDVTTNGPVEVVIDLSAAERDVTLRGEIVRGSVRTGVGIRFTNLHAMGFKTIENYLRRNGCH
ncbi:MAG: PilZ domain-containing protein [Deltaproteobacteria bacterium]|nr:PilZ domain-containing protein [Deltaproteobacteria bacterium]